MEKFLELMADIFDVDAEDISLDTVFRDEIEDFSSLMGFSIIVTMEEEYHVKISVKEFLACKTLGDIYAKI